MNSKLIAALLAVLLVACLLARNPVARWAADTKQTALVVAMLSLGANVNAADGNGRTLLHSAAGSENWRLVRELVARGADCNSLGGKHDWTALMMASAYGETEIVKLLLEHGADAKVRRARGAGSALIGAGNAEVARLLVEKGCDVNETNNVGRTPLLAASFPGDRDLVKFLLEKGADPNAKDRDGMTPLMHANKPEIVRMLLAKGARVNEKAADGMSVLGRAIDLEQKEKIRLLEAAGAKR